MASSTAIAVLLLLVLGAPSAVEGLTEEWRGQDPLNRTRQRPELEWGPVHHTLSTVEVNKQPLSQLLSSVVGTYKYTLPRIQLQRGLAYLGAATRLRALLRAMMAPHHKKSFKVGVIGGSISWGQWTSKRGITDWFSIVSSWMFKAFPHANITARNGCTPGIPTSYMILCLELSVDMDVDLVFMEYTLNDAMPENLLVGNVVVRDAERLLRRVLQLPSRPAVVLMQVPLHGMANYPVGHAKNPKGKADQYRHFYETTEDVQGALAQYYDVQYLSLRTAMYRLGQAEASGFMWEDVFVDQHPGDHGHKIMADMVVHLMQQQVLGLLLQPWDSGDAKALSEPLPPPMYPGNVPPTAPMCVSGEGFRSFVQGAEGFNFTNEGTPWKPKPGYVATAPGSRMRIHVRTDRAGHDEAAGPVNVFVQYLRSYEHMGRARFSCAANCTCPEVVADAHHTERVSQVYMLALHVSQHANCLIQVEVLSETTSGEHKFKVSGVVVAERPGEQHPYFMLEDPSGFGLQQHTGDDRQVVLTKDNRTGGWDDHNLVRDLEAKYLQQQQQEKPQQQPPAGVNTSATASGDSAASSG